MSVTYGASSKLEGMSANAWLELNIESLSIPDSAFELSNSCFRDCESLRSVMFGVHGHLENWRSLRCLIDARFI